MGPRVLQPGPCPHPVEARWAPTGSLLLLTVALLPASAQRWAPATWAVPNNRGGRGLRLWLPRRQAFSQDPWSSKKTPPFLPQTWSWYVQGAQGLDWGRLSPAEGQGSLAGCVGTLPDPARALHPASSGCSSPFGLYARSLCSVQLRAL